MNLFFNLLKIRYLQFFRVLQDLGWIRLIILVVLGVVSTAELWDRLKSESQAIGFIILILLCLGMIHINRKDKSFFQLLNIPTSLFCFGEYLVFTIPITIVLFLVSTPVAGLIFLIGIFGISWIPLRLNISNKTFKISFISPRHFEIISGIRRSYIYLIIIYLIAILGSIKILIIPLAIFLITAIFTEFNREGESQQMVEIFAVSPTQFLYLKVKTQLYFFGILTFPLGILFAILHLKYAWLMLPILSYAMLIITISILGKYYFYRPNSDITETALFNMLLLFGGFFVPVMMPIIAPLSIFFAVRYYRKAVQNLKNYLIN